jgi:YesN/AraC family two-component response regulator
MAQLSLMGQIIDKILAGRSILIIDDEPKIQEVILKYFERAKIPTKRLVFASNGQEALLKVRNQEFGLVIVDIVMPRLNGLQLVKIFKNEMRLRSLPLLMISGNLHSELVNAAVILGVKNILAKPFNYENFMERVCETLKIAA